MSSPILFAVTADLELSGAATTLEIGGLLFLAAGVCAILAGILQGGDDTHAGSRSVGYGVAITAAAGLSLYISTELGGDPFGRAVQATWLYPLITIAGCLLYVSRTINQSIDGKKQRSRKRHDAVAELSNAGQSGEYTRPARHGKRRGRGTSRFEERHSRSSREYRP